MTWNSKINWLLLLFWIIESSPYQPMALFSLTLNQWRKNSTHLLYDSLWPSISRKTLSLVRKTNKRACHFLWVIILILKYLWMGFSYLFCINYSYTNAFGPTEKDREHYVRVEHCCKGKTKDTPNYLCHEYCKWSFFLSLFWCSVLFSCEHWVTTKAH